MRRLDARPDALGLEARLKLATRALAGVALAAITLLTARRVRGARNGVSSPAMAVKQTDATHGLPDKEFGFTFCRLRYQNIRRARKSGWGDDYPQAD